jgi:glycine cleavage system H protein
VLVIDELKYSEDHIWVRYEENHTVTLGITDFGQSQFGRLNYLELPNEGDEIVSCEPLGSAECRRLFNDIYSPVCGKVVAVNRDVIDNPALINTSPYNRGWIVRAKLFSLSDIDLLMSSDDYEEYIVNNGSPRSK